MSSFPIEIDATQLFVRGFIIPGETSDFLDSLHVQTVLLEPGSYGFQIQSGVSADFVFVVTPEGSVDYERAFDGFLAGRGSSRLTISGFEVTLDARGLTGAGSGGGVLLAQMPRTNDDWISVKTCRLVPQTIYQVQQGSGELCSFTFALARDGTFSYDETHDVSKGGALSGQGTSRLEFHGFKVTVDATGITKILVVHPIFGLKAVDDGRLSVVVLPAGPFSLQLDRGVTGLGFAVGIHGEVTALPHMDELLAIEKRDGDTLVRVLAISVAFAPRTMDFGGVVPGSSGPNIIPETTPGTPLVSTNGAVIITVPDNTRVTAAIVGDTTRFKVRDIILLREVLEPIDPQPPGHPPLPLIKMKVPEEVGNSDGITPLSIETGQILYVRVEYHALHVEGTFTATLSIKGETWNPIEVPLSLFLANVITTVDTTHLDVVKGEQVIVPITVVSIAGPAANVSYQQSRGDPHVGLVITDTTVHVEARQSVKANLTVTAQRDAAVGPKSLFVYQTAFNRTVGMILPVNVLDAPLPGTGIDSSVLWEQAVPFGIQVDEAADGWNAGRVHDVISLGSGGLLLGTAKGGVWVANATDAAVPHSNDWDNPDINCLARGLDDRNHFYAGCDSGGALFESEPDTAFFGFLAWHQIPLVDPSGRPITTGSIYRIAVVQLNRKLVLATQNGVFWADIPSLGGRYAFRQASSLPAGAFSGATPGPNGSVVVGAWGDGGSHFGIFFGDWSSGDLVFERMTVPNEAMMFWTTLASCDSDLNRMYAAASDKGDFLISVLRHNHHSDGMSWGQCNTDAVDAPPGRNLLDSCGGFSMGGWIKTLRVSPTRPNVVTINWANSFISFSGGGAPWEAIDQIHVPGATDWDRSPQYNAHMHADGHATVFDLDDERTLYIATDGGVAMTPDRGHTFFSKFNAHLTNLMFDCQPGREGTYGTLAVSAFPTGLIAGGLQDNGDLYCQITPGLAPWQSLSAGDGKAMQFLPVGQRLIWYVNDGVGVKVSRWDGVHFVDTVVVPRADGSPKDEGLRDPYIELVERPSFRDSSTSQLMVAVGCPDGSRTIYGLFVDADGGNIKWQSLGLLPSEGRVRALASLHGDSIWIGTAEGRIFSMGSKSGSAIEFATPRNSSQPGGVDRFLIVSEELAYAVYNTTAGAGLILQSNLLSWDPFGSNSGVAKGVGLPTNEGSLYAMAIDRDARPPALFAATDNRVYVSRDEADTWRLATSGLPKRPHCADLSVDRGDGHNRFLYMSTFGRSVWRAALK